MRYGTAFSIPLPITPIIVEALLQLHHPQLHLPQHCCSCFIHSCIYRSIVAAASSTALLQLRCQVVQVHELLRHRPDQVIQGLGVVSKIRPTINV
jgi:hypothetical protein